MQYNNIQDILRNVTVTTLSTGGREGKGERKVEKSYSIGYLRSLPPFLFLDNIEKFKKNLSKVLNIENGVFKVLWSKCSIFHNISEYIVFQRRQKALSRDEG